MPLVWWLVCVILLLLGLVMLRDYVKTKRHLGKFVGPRGWPILGNIMEFGMNPKDNLATVRRWVRKYDYENYRIYLGPVSYLMISNPHSVEYVLSSNVLTFKLDLYNFFKPWLGEGLLTSNGQRWKSHRKVITPSFHFQVLQDFLAIMLETTDRFMLLLDTYAERGEMFDFQDVITLSSIDVICECAMGTKLNTIGGNKSVIVKAMNEICEVIESRVFSMIKRTDFLFQFSSDARRQEKNLQILRTEFSKIIEKRREFLKSQDLPNTNPDDFKRPKMAFLDNLLTATIDGAPLTFQDIFEEVSTFIFEGHDTTATALAFIGYCLSRHPEAQQKAFVEQMDICGKDMNVNPTSQQLNDMKYLEMVIKESLRLYPSVPMIARTLVENVNIDGKVVPKDTTLVVSLIDVSSDPRIFPQPLKFIPERFESHNRTNNNPFDYVPFSAGPRNCIGQKFAMMELKVTISKMIRRFEILPAVDGLSSGIDPLNEGDTAKNPYDVVLAALVTLKSVNGIYLRLRKRT